MSDPRRYAYQFDPEDQSTAAKVLRLVGQGKRVLELGTAMGSMTEVMQRHYGCQVVGVELSHEAAEAARPFSARMLVADLDTLNWAESFGEERFEVVVAADVLEHLRDPWACLRAARQYLRPDGALVVSVPNVTHSALVAQLMSGRFPYTDKGLLDRTHLRFFTRADLEDLLLATGFLPVVWERNLLPVAYTELASAWWSLPPAQRDYLASQPDATTYQFIVKALPGTEAGALAKLHAELGAARAEIAALAQRCEEEAGAFRAELSAREQAQAAWQAEAQAREQALVEAHQGADRAFRDHRDAYHHEHARSESLELRLGQQIEATARQAEAAAQHAETAARQGSLIQELEAERARLLEQLRHPLPLIGAAIRARWRTRLGG